MWRFWICYFDAVDLITMLLITGFGFCPSCTTDVTLENTSGQMDLQVKRDIRATSLTDGKTELCCYGVLGYASDNVSANFPCQGRPCCNSSERIAVVPIDHALGFRFECMPYTDIQPLCYESGSEVRTSNHDPDFIPRACCPGSEFKIRINQWYAATIVKCEKKQKEKS